MIAMVFAAVCLVAGSEAPVMTGATWSLEYGQEELMVMLEEHPELLNQTDSYGGSLLMNNVAEGRLEVVKMLIGKGADVNAVDKDGMGAVHLGALRGLAEYDKVLIDAGAMVTTVDKWGRTPLHLAVLGRSPETVELLLKAGVDPNARDGNGRSALDIACERQDCPAIGRLIIAKANLTWYSALVTGRNGDLALMCAGCPGEVAGGVVEGRTALGWAACYGNVEALKIVQGMGGDINVKGPSGESALSLAVIEGHTDAVEYLRRAGADVDVYMAAAMGDMPRLAMLLGEDGANVNAKDRRGWTPLHWACLAGKMDVAEFLVKAGADRNARGNDGATALHVAAWKGQTGILAAFIRGDGGCLQASDDWAGVLLWAVGGKHAETVRFLLDKGAGAGRRDGEWGPIHSAAEQGNIEIAEMLISAGADPGTRNDQGVTALSMAAQRGHIEVCRAFIRRILNSWDGIASSDVEAVRRQLDIKGKQKVYEDILVQEVGKRKAELAEGRSLGDR